MKKTILAITVILFSVSVFSQTFTGSSGTVLNNSCSASNEFPITVSGVGVLGTTVLFNNINFTITHDRDGDLDISLIAPNGAIIQISTDNGGVASNYINTTISYDATVPITTGTAPFSGTYSAEGDLTQLYGLNADGVWKLRICDDSSTGTSGTLNGWSITFGNLPTPPTNDNCSNAIPLTVNADFNCGAITNGTVYGATASLVDGNSCLGSEDDDVWFSFVPIASTGRISLLDVIGSNTNLVHSLWSGPDCNSLSLVTGSCSDPNISNLTGLTIGQTYYLRVNTFTQNPFQTTSFNVCIGSGPTPPDYVTLEIPTSASTTAGVGVLVPGRIQKTGLTDLTPGQAPGIQAWVGYSTSNTNPNTWTNWIVANYNQKVGTSDQYVGALGSTLGPGTYYYATRFLIAGGEYYYGGIDSGNNGNFWDGTTFQSGILTVAPPIVPENDDCSGAIALTVGNVFADYPVIGNTYGTTDSATTTINCDGTPKLVNSNVYYTVTVPASGAVTIETRAVANNSLSDTVMVASIGSCTSLIGMACSDNTSGLALSLLSMFGQVPGSTLFITVYNYAISVPVPTASRSKFLISAYTAVLGNNDFDSSKFTYYPNPIQDVLNLSYNQEISNIEVFNLLGQKMISKSIHATEAKIDFANLPKGVYLVNVSSDNKMKTIKVVKE